MWLLFAVGSAFFAGISAVLAKGGLHHIDSKLATALRTTVVLLFAWLLVFLSHSASALHTIELKTWLFLILSGIATGASWLCYFKALQKGPINQIVPIDKSSTIITMLLAFILFREPLTIFGILAMVLIALGTYLMIDHSIVADSQQNLNHSWFFYALCSAIFASLTAILGKVGIEQVDSNLGTAIRTVVVFIMAWLIVIYNGKAQGIHRIHKKDWFLLILSGIATGASWLCYFRALQIGPASIVVPIDKLSILVSIFFSYFIFHEKLKKIAMLGLLFIISGTLLLLL